MIIREDDSQTSGGTSSDEELSDWQRDNMNYAQKMATSKDPIDRRFINLYIYRKATQKSIRFGLENDILLSKNRRHKQTDNPFGSYTLKLTAEENRRQEKELGGDQQWEDQTVKVKNHKRSRILIN